MDSSFKKIAVIGAGTMGSGIAAQIANAGHEVMLLDLPAKNAGDASPAERAIERLLASDPPQLMHKRNAARIITGSITDDFDRLAECDWIIEAVVERLDIKKDLYKRLDSTISRDCVVSSNTSTIPIRLLVEDMPTAFRERFAITHYFNPVRYMRLLELVRGTDTRDDVIDQLADFNDHILGKGVVRCADTPGFLGNRVGVFALQVGIDEAMRCGLDIEQADALMGRPMGIPKTGVFGLYDLIGIDLMVDVVASL
ncbi:MAG: 3-hydroxyacyl-CoA dehydrogenase family protein, partial [Candidatus Puniceispirillaceae bacterium]